MTLLFLGKDPGSENGGSPTVWLDDVTDEYVLQGWRVTDGVTVAALGHIPPGETVIRFPRRMLAFFPEAGASGT